MNLDSKSLVQQVAGSRQSLKRRAKSGYMLFGLFLVVQGLIFIGLDRFFFRRHLQPYIDKISGDVWMHAATRLMLMEVRSSYHILLGTLSIAIGVVALVKGALLFRGMSDEHLHIAICERLVELEQRLDAIESTPAREEPSST